MKPNPSGEGRSTTPSNLPKMVPGATRVRSHLRKLESERNGKPPRERGARCPTRLKLRRRRDARRRRLRRAAGGARRPAAGAPCSRGSGCRRGAARARCRPRPGRRRARPARAARRACTSSPPTCTARATRAARAARRRGPRPPARLRRGDGRAPAPVWRHRRYFTRNT